MRTALVTGSSGFIGRNFARHLHEAGWSVSGIDVTPGGYTTVCDARGFFRRDDGSRFRWDLVIHAAAVVGGRHVIEHDPLRQAVNLELDAGLFSWARRAKPGRVVYFSSAAVYPVRLQAAGLKRRLEEGDAGTGATDPLGRPDALYGWAKATGEYLARLYRDDGGAVTVVRPFSGYGPDQDETYPFGAFAGRAARREDPFMIWGDGEQVRDFIHVDDIIAAVMAMIAAETPGPVNLGTGIPCSMLQLAMVFCATAGYAPVFEPVPSAPSGVPYRVADPKALYAFCPAKIPLEHGVRQALHAHRATLAGTRTP
jgi:nucleoside-diphosphate-sugar epimerase